MNHEETATQRLLPRRPLGDVLLHLLVCIVCFVHTAPTFFGTNYLELNACMIHYRTPNKKQVSGSVCNSYFLISQPFSD